MSANRCPYEDELLDVLGRGYLGPELAAHVEACASCSELRLVAGALLDERSAALTEAAVPNAGTMLWRLQMRHRQEVQTAARRSLVFGQALTLVIALALVATLIGTDLAVGVRDVVASIRLSTPLLFALVASIVAAPIAGVVVARQK